MKYGLNFDQQELERLCREHNVALLGLFGSYARGDASEESDVDLAIRLNNEIGLLELVRLERKFERLFNKKVDLVMEKALSPYFKDEVLAEMEVLYG